MMSRSEMERTVNKPVEFTIGGRAGKVRTLQLSEPPLLELIDILEREANKLVNFYLNNRSLVDGLLDGSGTKLGASILKLQKYIRPVLGELYELIEILDEAEGIEHPVASIITMNQTLELIPIIAEIINIEEIRKNFIKALEAIGVETKLTPDSAESESPIELGAELESSPALS